jgi:molecular chaperone DnaK
MTRAKLEALVEDLIARTLPPCKTALSDAGISASDIDEIVMVGGMTRMPKVLAEVKNFLEKTQTKVLTQMKLLQWVQQFKQVCFKEM